MIKNYWRTALRNLWHTRTFSFINILGLAIGISAALVIYLIVHFDLSFENFQPNRDRIYRVVLDADFSGETFHMAGVPYPLPAAAAKEVAGITSLTQIFLAGPKVTIPKPGGSGPSIFKVQKRVIIVGHQLHYSLNTDLGFKKDAIVNFDVPYTADARNNTRFLLLNRIQTLPGIERAGIGGVAPSTELPNSSEFSYTNGKQTLNMQLQLRDGDSNYIHIYHLQLLGGRNLHPSDSPTEVIINLSLCRLLGFKNPGDAIYKTLFDGSQPIPIVGVIADFHQGTMHTPIKPLVLTWSNKDHFVMHIALGPQTPDGKAWKTTLAHVEKAFRESYPNKDFTFEFLDESIAKYYTAEQQLTKLLRWATGLTIFISCMGLAGLVIFTTNTRTKEIGIRKVLGAPVSSIITLLSKEFVNLLLIAFGIAAPIAWWSVHKWLESFAYRAPVHWWIFPLAGITMMGIALLTMSIRTIRAATANPADALRSE